MKIKDLRKKTPGELQKVLEDNKKALSDFRFEIAGSKIKDVKKGKRLKKEIAQTLTLLNEAK